MVNTDFTTSHGQKDTAITRRAISLSAHDASMTVTCKFSKRTTFVPGKTTYTAEDWGLLLLDALLTGDWGIPVVIISDRDRKCLS